MNAPLQSLIHFRVIALLEGLSFLLLLGAMPFKYLLEMPMGVKVLGWAHGALFVAYGVTLLRALVLNRWKLSRGALAFFASLIPFGTFVFDRSLSREIAAKTAESDPQ